MGNWVKVTMNRRRVPPPKACNPPLANKALEAEPDIGVLLPCNVVLREDDDQAVTLAFMDPESFLQLVDNPRVAEIASEVHERLSRVQDTLIMGTGSDLA